MVAVFLLEPLKHSFSALPRAAVQSNAHVCSKRRQSRCTTLLFMLEESQGVTHNLAGTLVAATTDLILDELLEMGANDVTGRHHRSGRTKLMLSIFDSHGADSELCVRDEAPPAALTRPPA
jgi:hypothetical protein